MYKEKEGVIAGTIGAVGTVVGIGVAAAGSSAATLTTGLAAAGAVVGGGMVAGTCLVAAAPIAVGFVAYEATKVIKDLFWYPWGKAVCPGWHYKLRHRRMQLGAVHCPFPVDSPE